MIKKCFFLNLTKYRKSDNFSYFLRLFKIKMLKKQYCNISSIFKVCPIRVKMTFLNIRRVLDGVKIIFCKNIKTRPITKSRNEGDNFPTSF